MDSPEFRYYHSALDARLQRVNGLISSMDRLTQVERWRVEREDDRRTFTRMAFPRHGLIVWQKVDVDRVQANILRKDVVTSEERLFVPEGIANRMNGAGSPYQFELTTSIRGAYENPDMVTLYKQQGVWSCNDGKEQFAGRFSLKDNATDPQIDIEVTHEDMFSSNGIHMDPFHLDLNHVRGNIPGEIYAKFYELFTLGLVGNYVPALADQLRDQVNRSLQALQLPWYPRYVIG